MGNSVFFRPLTKLSGYISTLQDTNDFNNKISINHSLIYQTYDPISAFRYNSDAISVLSGDCWLSFTLKNNYFYITHYELHQRRSTFSNLLENWVFEGSNDDKTWKILDRKVIKSNDPFYSLDASKVFKAKQGVYQSFKLKHSGLLVLNKIEIYGFLCDTKEYCQLNSLFKRSCKTKYSTNIASYFFIVALSTK